MNRVCRKISNKRVFRIVVRFIIFRLARRSIVSVKNMLIFIFFRKHLPATQSSLHLKKYDVT